MSALDLDALEALARRCVTANEKVDAATNAYARWDAQQEALAPHEDLGLHGAEVLALITRLRAAEGALRAIARGDARDVLLPQEGDRPPMEGARDYFSGIVEANRKLKEMWPDYDDSDVPALAVARAMLITLNAERDATMRAAEARTAWQPIETAPHGEWVLVYGTRFRAALPSVEPARLDEYGWADKGGYSVRPTHWQSLPAAPEAP